MVKERRCEFFSKQMKKLTLTLPNEPNWFTFAVRFSGLFPRIPLDEAPPEVAWTVGATLKETEESYRRAEAPFIPQIENVIRKLCETGSASMPSKAVSHFLGVRSTVVGCFFLKLSISDGPSRYLTIIPFPSLPAPVVTQWFLIDWWAGWGPYELAFQYQEGDFP
jgi:hypothetical protein